MASSQKRAQQRRLRTNWFLSCFGFARKPATGSEKKCRKSGARRKWFRICLPKIKIMCFRKRKVSFDTKTAAIKATQSIMLEASKAQQLKLQNHASNTQHKPKEILKESTHLNKRGQEDQSKPDTCLKPKHGHPILKGNMSFLHMKVTRDSLIGMSIMVITIIIMSIWGRLHAILCMSAWFYCVPLLRARRNVNVNVASNEDSKQGLGLATESFQKKMVSQRRLLKDHEVAKGGI